MRLVIALLLALVAPAVADTYSWTGALSTDWQVAANWTTNGVVAASVPCDNDDVVIDAGTAGITAGLDVSACDYDSVVVGPNFDYSVGNSTSDPLRFAADLVVIAGGGDGHWLKAESPGWDEIIIKSVGPNNTDDIYLTGSTAGVMNLKKGTVSLGSGLVITTLVVDPADGLSSNVALTSAATATTMYVRTGGVTMTGGTITTANIDAGTLTASAGTVTNLLQRGGTVYWNTTSTMTDAKIFAGTFDASGDVRPKTITSMQAHYGAALDLDNAIGNITVTNGVKGYAGTIRFPSGQLITY
jgi:hypothetical protein